MIETTMTNLGRCVTGLTVFTAFIAFVGGQVNGQTGNAGPMELQFLPVNPDVSVLENEPIGTEIGQITVSGGARSQAGSLLVFCSLSDDSTFALQAMSPGRYKVIVQRVLDREQRDMYHIRVTCQDVSGDQASLSIAVRVGDVNDNSPVFARQVYNVTLFESMPSNTFIYLVEATDRDVGSNAMITYSLDPPHNAWFALHNPSDVLIMTTASLDREVTPHLELTVVASDRGVPSLQSRALVHVNLLDLNDNAPVSSRANYQFFLPQGAPSGTAVGQVSFTDMDEGANARITVTIQSPTGMFTMDGQTLKLASPLGAASVRTHHLTLVATDHGMPPLLSAPVAVTVNVTGTARIG